MRFTTSFFATILPLLLASQVLTAPLEPSNALIARASTQQQSSGGAGGNDNNNNDEKKKKEQKKHNKEKAPSAQGYVDPEGKSDSESGRSERNANIEGGNGYQRLDGESEDSSASDSGKEPLLPKGKQGGGKVKRASTQQQSSGGAGGNNNDDDKKKKEQKKHNKEKAPSAQGYVDPEGKSDSESGRSERNANIEGGNGYQRLDGESEDSSASDSGKEPLLPKGKQGGGKVKRASTQQQSSGGAGGNDNNNNDDKKKKEQKKHNKEKAPSAQGYVDPEGKSDSESGRSERNANIEGGNGYQRLDGESEDSSASDSGKEPLLPKGKQGGGK